MRSRGYKTFRPNKQLRIQLYFPEFTIAKDELYFKIPFIFRIVRNEKYMACAVHLGFFGIGYDWIPEQEVIVNERSCKTKGT